MHCEHCGTGRQEFFFNGHGFCCECMSELCSWFLDGGCFENLGQFAYALDAEEVESLQRAYWALQRAEQAERRPT